MTPFELRRAGLAQGGDRADRSGRSERAADRRRHRADADDEGRRVPAAPAGEPAQARRRHDAHRGGAVRRAHHRRADAAAALEHSPEVARHAPVIARTMKRLSNVRVRNVATVGGALAHGDPHMDLPPVLIALGASRAIAGPDGERELAGRGPAHRLLRNGARQQRTDRRTAHSGARQRRARPIARSPPARPTTGRRSAWRSRSTPTARAIEIGAHRGERGDAKGDAADRGRKAARPAPTSTTRRCKAAGDAAAAEAEIIADVRGSAAYKRELLRVYVGARGARGASGGARDDRDRRPGEAGRPLAAAARSAREGDRPRRIHPHHAAARHAASRKIFRSTVAHGRIKSIDVSAARALPGVYARLYRRRRAQTVIPDPYYGPAFHDQPILALGKVHYVGEPVAVVLAADPHIAEQAVQLIVAEYEELPAVFDEVEAAENKMLVHDELKPAGTFADLKHLKGRKGTNMRARFPAAARRRRQGFRRRRAGVRAHLPHPESAASAARAARLDRRLPRRRRHHLFRLAGAVLRAHRDRAPARLAGKPRAREGALSRRRLRRQALHQAGSAGGGAVDAGAAAGQGRAHDGRAVSTPSPSIRARSASRAASTRTAKSSRANARCGGTAAPMPISARA